MLVKDTYCRPEKGNNSSAIIVMNETVTVCRDLLRYGAGGGGVLLLPLPAPAGHHEGGLCPHLPLDPPQGGQHHRYRGGQLRHGDRGHGQDKKGEMMHYEYIVGFNKLQYVLLQYSGKFQSLVAISTLKSIITDDSRLLKAPLYPLQIREPEVGDDSPEIMRIFRLDNIISKPAVKS